MKGILSDNDIMGHVQVLLYILDGEAWGDIWRGMRLAAYTLNMRNEWRSAFLTISSRSTNIVGLGGIICRDLGQYLWGRSQP